MAANAAFSDVDLSVLLLQALVRPHQGPWPLRTLAAAGAINRLWAFNDEIWRLTCINTFPWTEELTGVASYKTLLRSLISQRRGRGKEKPSPTLSWNDFQFHVWCNAHAPMDYVGRTVFDSVLHGKDMRCANTVSYLWPDFDPDPEYGDSGMYWQIEPDVQALHDVFGCSTIKDLVKKFRDGVGDGWSLSIHVEVFRSRDMKTMKLLEVMDDVYDYSHELHMRMDTAPIRLGRRPALSRVLELADSKRTNLHVHTYLGDSKDVPLSWCFCLDMVKSNMDGLQTEEILDVLSQAELYDGTGESMLWY